ncbi:hypothetical protein N7468_003642 [Penicillium chermesinum]|uniref:Uncharacterized protein n=1 Tax=Penicillium chermesinum TaxID=63820 RepID=A0A9W9P9F7_9EURO|nr:uncharacterized protein N7468_003642 [Penicillium chermesinum]KAJ5239023.1 hypothetical protein N7468_003642 [Penicillium chermesinum]
MAQPGNDRGAMGLHSQSLSTRRLPAQRSPLSNWGTFRRDPVAVQGALDKVSSTDSGKGRHSQPEAPSESRPAPRIVRPSELGPSPLSYPPNSSRRVDSAEPSSIGPTPSNHSQAQSQYTIDPYGQLVHYPCLEAQYASGLGQGNETLSYDSLAFMAPEQRIQSMGDNLQSDPQNLSRTPQYAPLLGGFVHHYPASRPSSMAPQSHPPGMHAANGSSGSTTVSRIPYSHPQATRRASHVSDARGEQNISVSTKSSGSTPNHPTLFSAPNLALPPRFLHSDTGRQGLSLNSNLNPTSSAQRSSSAPKIPHGLPLPTYNQSTRPPYRPDGSLAQPTALPSADPNKRPRAESGARGEEKLPAAKRPRELHDPSRKGKALAEKLKSSDIPRPNTAKPTKYQLNPAALKYHMAHRDLVEDFRLSDAAPVAEYNPETIARDILLAADKHPTMGGLNSHLAPLASTFRGVASQPGQNSLGFDRLGILYVSEDTYRRAPRAPRASPPTVPAT